MFARFITVLVAILCLTADYLSKSWARATLEVGQSQQFIPGLLNFTLTSNTGAAFSLGAGNGGFMFMLAMLMTGLITAWIIKRELSNDPPTNLERIGLGCILGGAIGNLVDRFFLGRVTDFLEFAFMTFPVFNVADSLIDIGIGLMVIAALTQARKSDESGSESKTGDSSGGINSAASGSVNGSSNGSVNDVADRA